MNRLEHVIPAGIILLVGVWVAFISFTQQPAEAFVFPRLISALFVGLAAVVFFNTLTKDQGKSAAIPMRVWVKILPGLAIGALYVFWAAKALGFYTATTLAVFILITAYDPASHSELKSWLKRALITAVFVAVLYGLFAMLLNVFTPREFFA